MSDSTTKRTLTEISHLFLSSVRDRQTGSAPRPDRRPPQAQVSIDLTPEEFAEVFSTQGQDELAPIAPVTAVIASHFGPAQAERVREYARHLAAADQRIGLIELDASACRVACFEPSLEPVTDGGEVQEKLHTQQLIDTIEEMNVDVDRWILYIPNPRLLEARPLLRQVGHWALLCACDHDGIVAAYRTLKGLSDLHHPELSLAVLGASDDREAERIHTKLAGVCQQFLAWTLRDGLNIGPAGQVSEHTVLTWRSTHDKAAMATTAHWQVVSSFLARTKRIVLEDEQQLHDVVAAPVVPAAPVAPAMAPAPAAAAPVREPIAPAPAVEARHTPAAAPSPVAPAAASSTAPLRMTSDEAADSSDAPEVIELEGNIASTSAILNAVLSQGSRQLVETPIRPPAFEQARLVVDRDRRLVLFAVAREGLSDLGAIGKAFAWLNENRNLVAMALPQLNVDAHAMPSLRLLIDHADLRAEELQPMLAGKTVTLETYRKLRWGSRTGLLLEAA